MRPSLPETLPRAALGIPGYLTQVALSSVVYLALGAALDRAGLKKKLGEI